MISGGLAGKAFWIGCVHLYVGLLTFTGINGSAKNEGVLHACVLHASRRNSSLALR